jgi:hypothetical protein
LKQLEVNKKSSEEFKMMVKTAVYWNGLSLSPAMDVLRNAPQGLEFCKSEFTDLEVDLTGRVPSAYARTSEGQRVDLSVFECELDVLREFAGKLASLRGDKEVRYQIGYVREPSRGNPKMRYVRIDRENKPEEHFF